MTDDVIYSMHYMRYINRAILAYLHHRPLKLGRLIVLKETLTIKIMFPWQLTLFQSPSTLFQSVGDFQHKKHKMVPQTQANIFICLLDHTYEAPLANIKMERQRWPEKPLILGRSGTQYVAIVTTVEFVLWSTFSRILLQRIKHF